LADPNALRGGAVSLELPLSPILANTIYCSIQQNRISPTKLDNLQAG